MKLRYSPTSPYVRKVMVVALETGLAERIERIPTTVAPTKYNEEVARENPLVKVPALTTDDGMVLYDSPVICEYLDTLHGGQKLFPATGKTRWTALRQQALADGILDAAILGRYEILRASGSEAFAASPAGRLPRCFWRNDVQRHLNERLHFGRRVLAAGVNEVDVAHRLRLPVGKD